MPGITSIRRRRTVAKTLISALALTLAACGGGGGGGGFVSSNPPPPPAPPEPPLVAISAPARTMVAPGADPMIATAGGPSFSTGPSAGTEFPLLQTVLLLDDSSIRPDPAEPPATATANVGDSGLSIDINGETVPSGVNPNLDWTRAGWWAVRVEPGPWDYGGPVDYRAAFVAGYETPVNAMPMTGTAIYQGSVTGSMFTPSNSAPNGLACRCMELILGGAATFTADFGARSLNGNLTEMAILGWDDVIGPWNDVAFSATIAGNGFTGTTHVTTAPAGTMGLNATGTLEGRFFGPSAEEAGAVWTLFDGTNSAIGTVSGRRGP